MKRRDTRGGGVTDLLQKNYPQKNPALLELTAKVMNYFYKKLLFKYLTRFWMGLCYRAETNKTEEHQ